MFPNEYTKLLAATTAVWYHLYKQLLKHDFVVETLGRGGSKNIQMNRNTYKCPCANQRQIQWLRAHTMHKPTHPHTHQINCWTLSWFSLLSLMNFILSSNPSVGQVNGVPNNGTSFSVVFKTTHFSYADTQAHMWFNASDWRRVNPQGAEGESINTALLQSESQRVFPLGHTVVYVTRTDDYQGHLQQGHHQGDFHLHFLHNRLMHHRDETKTLQVGDADECTVCCGWTWADTSTCEVIRFFQGGKRDSVVKCADVFGSILWRNCIVLVVCSFDSFGPIVRMHSYVCDLNVQYQINIFKNTLINRLPKNIPAFKSTHI